VRSRASTDLVVLGGVIPRNVAFNDLMQQSQSTAKVASPLWPVRKFSRLSDVQINKFHYNSSNRNRSPSEITYYLAPSQVASV